MLMRFEIKLHTFLKEVTDDSAVGNALGIGKDEKFVINAIRIAQEVLVKPRPNEELHLIKEWYEETWRFQKLLIDDSPTAKQWQEFEEKLTPGTLRNSIRVQRTLVEIAQDENKGKRQAMFDEMLAWINELHPLEKEGLTKRAYEIVKSQMFPMAFREEITVPLE